MSESLFNVFGDRITRQAIKNVSRQPLFNIENMGKTVSSENCPIKPNEPVKKIGETKKSFFSNAGKALQSTPERKVFTPKPVNVGPLIYTDDDENVERGHKLEDLEFTRPSYKNDNYHRNVFDFLTFPELEVVMDVSPPATPPPKIKRLSMEFDCTYHDEIFTDDFSCSLPDDYDLSLPALY